MNVSLKSVTIFHPCNKDHITLKLRSKRNTKPRNDTKTVCELKAGNLLVWYKYWN